MPLVSMRQLLDHAAEHGYGLPAFNVNNLEQVQAIMEAANQVGSPVIMQASAGARKYAGEPFLRHLIEAAIESYPHIPVVMHQDHGQSPPCRPPATGRGPGASRPEYADTTRPLLRSDDAGTARQRTYGRPRTPA